jgi:hypothetical protein
MSLYDFKASFAVLICLSASGTDAPLAAQATRVIRCGSASGGQLQCRTDGRAENVRLVRDLNRDRCRQGASWGFTDSFIWTNNGCWADFEVVYRGLAGPGRNTRIITCGATSGLQARCETNGFATAVRLRRDLSGTRCSQPSSLGVHQRLCVGQQGLSRGVRGHLRSRAVTVTVTGARDASGFLRHPGRQDDVL